MQKLVIEGGKPLEGEIFLHGAKNSALPILAGTLLCDGETVLENCPRLTDVFAACRILTHLGCRCTVQEHTVTVQVRDLCADTIPEVLMQEMRSSIIFLGAVLGRSGSCHLSYPGGCELGPRPIDMHLDALRQMGAHFSVHGGQLDCTAPEGLHGAGIHLPFPSVGATENVMLAAVLAGMAAGLVTGLLHTLCGIPAILGIPAGLRGRHLRRRRKHHCDLRCPEAAGQPSYDHARPHCRRDLSGGGGNYRRDAVPAWCQHSAYGEYAPCAGTDRLSGISRTGSAAPADPYCIACQSQHLPELSG